MSTLERAIAIAAQAHAGQPSPSREPYILHPMRVLLSLDGETERIVAALHDVVEDTSLTLEDLASEGFSGDVLAAVDAMTHRDGESYEEYIERVAVNPVARRVKLSDLTDNMNIRRLPELTEKRLARTRRYHAAWLRLSALEREGADSPPAGHEVEKQ